MKPGTDDVIWETSYFLCLALSPHILCGEMFSRFPGCLSLEAGARAPGILGQVGPASRYLANRQSPVAKSTCLSR